MNKTDLIKKLNKKRLLISAKVHKRIFNQVFVSIHIEFNNEKKNFDWLERRTQKEQKEKRLIIKLIESYQRV